MDARAADGNSARVEQRPLHRAFHVELQERPHTDHSFCTSKGVRVHGTGWVCPRQGKTKQPPPISGALRRIHLPRPLLRTWLSRLCRRPILSTSINLRIHLETSFSTTVSTRLWHTVSPHVPIALSRNPQTFTSTVAFRNLIRLQDPPQPVKIMNPYLAKHLSPQLGSADFLPPSHWPSTIALLSCSHVPLVSTNTPSYGKAPEET